MCFPRLSVPPRVIRHACDGATVTQNLLQACTHTHTGRMLSSGMRVPPVPSSSLDRCVPLPHTPPGRPLCPTILTAHYCARRRTHTPCVPTKGGRRGEAVATITCPAPTTPLCPCHRRAFAQRTTVLGARGRHRQRKGEEGEEKRPHHDWDTMCPLWGKRACGRPAALAHSSTKRV